MRQRSELHDSELHIVVPGICGPLAETRSLENTDSLKRWINLLAKSRAVQSQNNVNDVIASMFNLNTGEFFPSAALTLLADKKYNAEKFYMHADPVHLQADMDHAILTSSKDLNISDSESAILRDLLNQHFRQDGLEFITLNNNQWFVSADHNIKLQTTPITEAVGRNINFILPTGKDSTRWKQVLTEAQMLLHSHEINSERENAGKLSINSLWFHGAGKLDDGMFMGSSSEHSVYSVCSDEKMLQGLASYLNCRYMPIPASAEEYIETVLADDNNSVNVLHLSELQHLVNYTDVSMWLDKMNEILEYWVYPMLKAAHKNNIKVILYPCNKTRYHFSKYDYLRFYRNAWRKDKLEDYVDSY